MKRLAVLTSGGDAPGMNAAIRSVVRTAIYQGLEIYGIRSGYQGLIQGDMEAMDISSVADIIQRGGTILGTARSQAFQTPEGQQEAVRQLKNRGIEGLIVLGGDGTFKGGQSLAQRGIPVIALPCSIDNDIASTDYTIGFFTAVATITEAMNKLRDTSSSHGRAHIIEVMGRESGDLALYAGIASGAESILIPEVPYDLEAVAAKMKRGMERGKRHHLIVLAEGLGRGEDFRQRLEKLSDIEIKVTVLGYVQRGGSPSITDRLLATRMGNEAVKLLLAGEKNLALAFKDQKILGVPLEAATLGKKPLDHKLYQLTQEVSI